MLAFVTCDGLHCAMPSVQSRHPTHRSVSVALSNWRMRAATIPTLQFCLASLLQGKLLCNRPHTIPHHALPYGFLLAPPRGIKALDKRLQAFALDILWSRCALLHCAAALNSLNLQLDAICSKLWHHGALHTDHSLGRTAGH